MMTQWKELIERVFVEGEERHDRTGVGTLSVFGGRMEFDLREYFPIETLKKTRYIDAFHEMLWFISGDTNIKFLNDNGIKIWDDWADKNGSIGPGYGYQWRNWPGRIQKDTHQINNPQDAIEDTESVSSITQSPNIDQMAELIAGIKKNPHGRRHIVTAWNPADLHLMGLPPCHRDFQCYVSDTGYLDLMWSQRSWDLGLGGPYNIAQYALLTHLIARATNLKPRKLSVNYGDAHVYTNHVEPLKHMLATQQPRDCKPQLIFKTDNTDIDGYKPGDFEIQGYESGPFVKLPVAV